MRGSGAAGWETTKKSRTPSMFSAFTFNYTVAATGAWARHPVDYVVLNAAFIPLVLLFAVVVRDVRERRPAQRKVEELVTAACDEAKERNVRPDLGIFDKTLRQRLRPTITIEELQVANRQPSRGSATSRGARRAAG